MDRAAALKAIRNGVIAACISGAATIGITLFAMNMAAQDSSGVDERIAYFNDPIIFFDVFLIFGCAFFLHKKSRAAAVILFTYFVFAKIMIAIEIGKLSNMWPALIFLFFYWRAIEGTFTYDKLERAENPNYKPSSKWLYFICIPICVILFGLVSIGIMSMIGVLPPTDVVPGNKVYENQRDVLISNNIVTKDETIEYYYSEGSFSLLDGGSVLTDHRVIIYFHDENDELQVYGLYFDEISSVDFQEKGNWYNTFYKVSTHDPENWLVLELSTESDGDRRFVDALKTKIANSSKAPF